MVDVDLAGEECLYPSEGELLRASQDQERLILTQTHHTVFQRVVPVFVTDGKKLNSLYQ
jgi:hypothetical protein